MFKQPASYVGKVFTCSRGCSRRLASARIARSQGPLPDLPDLTPPSYRGVRREVRNCVICGARFLAHPKMERLTCSRECNSKRRSIVRTEIQPRPCDECGEMFKPSYKLNAKRGRYCSNPCRMTALQRVPRHRNDGFVGYSPKGYRRIRVWEDGRKRVVVEHRWVMEQHLGRKLSPKEVVHHINHERTDNRIENLQLFASQRDHLAHEHAYVAENFRAS